MKNHDVAGIILEILLNGIPAVDRPTADPKPRTEAGRDIPRIPQPRGTLSEPPKVFKVYRYSVLLKELDFLSPSRRGGCRNLPSNTEPCPLGRMYS